MTNTEAMYILTKLMDNVPHSRGDGKSLTKLHIIVALAMGIDALSEQEKNDKRRNQMTAYIMVTSIVMGLIILINVLLAYAHAQKDEVCYVIINCTIMLMSMMQLIRQED